MYKIGLAILIGGLMAINLLPTQTDKNNLIDNNEKIYEEIYQAITNLEDCVDLSKYGPPIVEDTLNIAKKVLDDNPQIFYFDYKKSVYYSDGKFKIKYKESKPTVKNMIKELDNKIDNILSKYISSEMSDIEKVITIHDYIVLNTKYLSTDYCYDPYGVIVKGRGVCQGYAESMKLLLNKIGIECIYVSSDEMNHGWNIVNIDGENYHLDATWDDPISDMNKVTKYEYLALSDEEISKTHTWDKSKYPSCDSDKYKHMREKDYISKENYVS